MRAIRCNVPLFSAGGFNVLVGGTGNDRLFARGFNNLIDGGDGDDALLGYRYNALVGGAGADRILAGTGNLLIGGTGADRLHGVRANIFVAGQTAFDQDHAAWRALLDEWLAGDAAYATKIDHLTNGGGLNGEVAFNDTTLFDDDQVDVLIGGAPLDWFIAAANDRIAGRLADREILTLI